MPDGKFSRVYWQCRRGMLELDILLLGFMEKDYKGLSEDRKQVFDELLACPDQLLLEYLMGRVIPIDTEIADVVKQIRDAAGP